MSIWTDKQGRKHIGLMVSGQRIHRSLAEGTSAGDAKRLEADLRGALGRKQPHIPGDPPMTIVLAVYLQHAAHLRGAAISVHHANRIAPWLAKYTASQARECAAHIIKDMAGHYAPGTVNRSLACLKKGLSLAWEQNLVPENYGLRIKALPVNNKREVFLSVEQVHQLASHCTPQVQAAIWAALLTGARRGELLKIKAADIAADEITLMASNTKTLRTRVIPIVPALRPWLGYFPLAITAEGLKTAWQRARKATDMEHVNFHDLRHSCASILLSCGVDLYTIGKLLGHANTQTTQRYAHLQIEQQRTALNKLSQLVTPLSHSAIESPVIELGDRLQVQRTQYQTEFHREKLLKDKQAQTAVIRNTSVRILKVKRLPAWANRAQIDAVYRRAKELTKATGIDHEVDHIVPLFGKLVSGLHVEYNLQIVSKQVNRKKSNHY